MNIISKWLLLMVVCFFTSQLGAMKTNWQEFIASEWNNPSDITSEFDITDAWEYISKTIIKPSDIDQKTWDAYFSYLKLKYDEIQNKKSVAALLPYVDPIIASIKKVFEDGRQITKVEDFIKLFEIKEKSLSSQDKEKVIALSWGNFIGSKKAVEVGKDTYVHPHIIATTLGLYKFFGKGKKELNDAFNRIIGNSPGNISDISKELLDIFNNKAWNEFEPLLMNKVIDMVKKDSPPNFDDLNLYLATIIKKEIPVEIGKQAGIPINVFAKIDGQVINDKSKDYGNWFYAFKKYILSKINENKIKQLADPLKIALKERLEYLNIWQQLSKNIQDAFNIVKLDKHVVDAVNKLNPAISDNKIQQVKPPFNDAVVTFGEIKTSLEEITPQIDLLGSEDIARLKKFCEKPKVKGQNDIKVAVMSFAKSLDAELERRSKIETEQKVAKEKEMQDYAERELKRKELKRQEKAKLRDLKIKLSTLHDNLQALKNKLEILVVKLKGLKGALN